MSAEPVPVSPAATVVETGPQPRISTGPNTRLVTPARRRIGDSGLSVFPLALGANVFGWLVADAASHMILDAFVDSGGQLIDTADSYAGGRSETIIGSWLASRRNRDRVTIATKVGRSADFPGVSAKSITQAVEASLRRLRTETIDILLLHVDEAETPFDETLLAVDRLIREGKVRAFGTSDHRAERLVEARVACGMLGVAPMVALESPYSLMNRAEYEREYAPVVEAQDLAVLPRHVIAGGFLSGKYRSRAEIDRSQRARDLKPHLSRRGSRILSVVEDVAEEQGIPMATVAVAWLLTRPNVVAPVVSATSVEQLHELLAAPLIGLTRQQVAALDEVSAQR